METTMGTKLLPGEEPTLKDAAPAQERHLRWVRGFGVGMGCAPSGRDDSLRQRQARAERHRQFMRAIAEPIAPAGSPGTLDYRLQCANPAEEEEYPAASW